MNLRRFRNLWNRSAEYNDPKVDDIFCNLFTRYCELHRYYHTTSHIDHCLMQFNNAKGVLSDRDVVELAIWFHDVVYDSLSDDNEHKSAIWFSECAESSFTNEKIALISQCILSTTHRVPPLDNESKFVVDVDLSGLGQDWQGFRRDGGKIRMEHSHMDNEQYVRGQIAFMEKLLDRESIYATEHFKTSYEASAQSNIRRQLDIYKKNIE